MHSELSSMGSSVAARQRKLKAGQKKVRLQTNLIRWKRGQWQKGERVREIKQRERER